MVRRYAAMEKVYFGGNRGQGQTYDALRDLILKVYQRILEFEARALCQCHHNIAFQSFKNMFGGNSWKEKLTGISDADTTCMQLLPTVDAESQFNYSKELSDILSKQTDEIQMKFRESNLLTEALLEEVRHARKDQRDWKGEKLKQEVLSMLRTTDFEFGKNRNPKRSPGTCEWFLQHLGYQKWLKQTSTSCLWLTADPGCGKSVLSRYLVDIYSEITGGNATICYFFFKAGDQSGSATNCLCALLYQLFEQNEHSLTKYGIPEYRKGGHLADLFEPLWRLFDTVCRDPDMGQLICVLDALDECAASHRRILATRFAELCATDDSDIKFRLLITSRPDNPLRDAFDRGAGSNTALIRLSGENEQEVAAITSEINLVIDEEIGRFKETRERSMIYDDMHNILRRRINEVDNRTYLWVSLIFPELHDNAVCEEFELLQIFKKLPNTVEEAYESILSRSTNVERARKLLSIIMAAARALTLTELKIAFFIDEKGNYGKLDNALHATSTSLRLGEVPAGPREAAFRESIRQLCGLFIRTTGSKVYLIHQTAQEFLLESPCMSSVDQTRWKHAFKKADSHFVLARSCIRYLSLPIFDEQWLKSSNQRWKPPPKRSLSVFSSQNPFVEYAATHWTTHFNASNASETDELSAAASLLCSTDTHRFRTWYKIYWSAMDRSTPRTYTSLLVAASFDLAPVIHILLLRGGDITQVDDDGDTALHSAAMHKHGKAASKLLQWNAPINVKAKDGNTPLHSAAAWGSASILSLLLTHDAELQIRNNEGKTPLHRAAQYGHADGVRTLIRAGADVDDLDKEGRTSLHLAAMAGAGSVKRTEGVPFEQFKRTIEVLVQEGADTGLVDGEGKTARELAKQEDLEYLFGGLRYLEGKIEGQCA